MRRLIGDDNIIPVKINSAVISVFSSADVSWLVKVIVLNADRAMSAKKVLVETDAAIPQAINARPSKFRNFELDIRNTFL